MSQAPPISTRKATLWLCVKFLILIPFCLVIWLILLPYYAQLVGTGSAFLLKHALNEPVVSTSVWNTVEYRESLQGNPTYEPAITPANAPLRLLRLVLRRTETALSFKLEDGREPTQPEIGHLMTNIAPFIALVLATSGLGLFRRLRVMVLGILAIYLSHVITVIFIFVSMMKYGGAKTPFASAVGFISVTLPFLLWIVLAYWDRLAGFFLDSPTEE